LLEVRKNVQISLVFPIEMARAQIHPPQLLNYQQKKL